MKRVWKPTPIPTRHSPYYGKLFIPRGSIRRRTLYNTDSTTLVMSRHPATRTRS